MIYLIPALIILIALSGILSGSETALFSLSAMKVRSYRLSKDPKLNLIAKLLGSPQKLLVTILMLNVVMNILIQNVVSSLFGTFSGYLTTVGVPLLLTLIFGEVIPKSIALANNARVAKRVAPGLSRAERLFGPIRDFLTKLTVHLSSWTFFFLRRGKDISLGELKHALKTSRGYGVLEEEEARLIGGYLNLEEDIVKEHIRPRQDIVFYDINKPITHLVDLFIQQDVTRIPVVDGDLENLLGIMTSRRYFLARDKIKEPSDLKTFLKKPFFVPESIHTSLLLRQMYDKNEPLAMIVDEYGSITGLATLEDLVEMVVGEIADRREEKVFYTKATNDVVIASGKMELGELESLLGIEFESPSNMQTVGGFLIEALGDIPKSGTKYQTGHALFHVLASDVNRVRRVYVRRLRRKK